MPNAWRPRKPRRHERQGQEQDARVAAAVGRLAGRIAEATATPRDEAEDDEVRLMVVGCGSSCDRSRSETKPTSGSVTANKPATSTAHEPVRSRGAPQPQGGGSRRIRARESPRIQPIASNETRARGIGGADDFASFSRTTVSQRLSPVSKQARPVCAAVDAATAGS